MSSLPRFTLDVDRTVKLLSTLEGRDKLFRATSYALYFLSPRFGLKRREGLLAVAREFSGTRMVLRRLGALPAIYRAIGLIQKSMFSMQKFDDKTDQSLATWIAAAYAVFFAVEDVAWYSKVGLLPADSSWWATATVVVWLVALIISVVRSMRKLMLLKKEIRLLSKENESSDRYKQLVHQENEISWTLLGDLADFCNAVNFLPKGYLWAQSFPLWKVGAFGLISSLVGLRRLY